MHLFTSESVSEGHPDKLADQISDAVLDACLEDDPDSRVGCEVFTTTGLVLVGGEITTNTYVDIQEIARGVTRKVGYTRPEYGLDYESMSVLSALHSQSPDIAIGVNKGEGVHHEQGAGDQGMMFGFACSETEELMPAPIMLSHKLLLQATRLRREGKLLWLRPDAKSQVTIEYDGYVPKRITSVVISHQHDEGISYEKLQREIQKEIIEPVIMSSDLFDGEPKYYINPTGRFVIGGPQGDAGLTGRKTIVDTYGGASRHGGGAFSGKDPSKVDRSASYMARYIAKNLVGSDLCSRCEVQLAYAIGVPAPVSVMVNSFGTGQVPDGRLSEVINKVFDLTPEGIIESLNLKRPIYEETASYGHFGRDQFTWERLDRTSQLVEEVE